jgi:hypothetical protein
MRSAFERTRTELSVASSVDLSTGRAAFARARSPITIMVGADAHTNGTDHPEVMADDGAADNYRNTTGSTPVMQECAPCPGVK